MKFDCSIRPDFMLLTNNNLEAWNFVETYVNWCHQVDDLIDKDKEVSDESIVEMQLNWLMTVSGNVFFQANKNFLMPLLIMTSNAWLDANHWEKSKDRSKRTHSDVVKSLYHEVVFACVYLCGGWAALRRFTTLHREYQKDNYYGNLCT